MSDLRKAISVDDHVEPPSTHYREEQRYKVHRGNAIPMLDLDRV
ncbi:MAG TPA: hypothetical protein VG869_04550 [Acidimicrobiia bacterium]|nr:hypothetical protein [Acidimicrobiia bacterium]